MVTLREEYSKHKAQKNKAVNEAAVGWVLENVVLLNETFNREALQRLQQSILKFDSTFAPFASKVPEVKKSLDDAVELMNRITMGEKITRNDTRLKLSEEEKESIKEPATFMVKYMSILYNNLSRFFNKDMRALLDFPVFRKAAENPETPLRDLVESDRMKKAILHALVPSPEVQAILKRMYRSMELPNLDYGQIAEELLNLSINDFKSLMHVDKVPLVASEPKVQATEVATGTNPKAPTSPQVQSAEGDDDFVLNEQEQELLKEIGEIDVNQLNTVVKGIQKVQGIIKGFPELQKLNQDLEGLRAQALSTITQGGLRAGAKSKSIAATANMVYSFFDKIGDLWPKIKPLIPEDRPLAEEELNNIQTFLIRAQGGIMAKIGNWFKTRALPGLAPTQIATEIMDVVRAGQQDPESAMQATESLGNLFQRLSTLKLPPSVSPQGQPVTPGIATSTNAQGPAGAQGSGETTPASQSTTGAASQASQPAATGNRTLAGTGPQKIDPAQLPVAQKLASTLGQDVNNDTFVQQFNTLIKSGWKLTPP